MFLSQELWRCVIQGAFKCVLHAVDEDIFIVSFDFFGWLNHVNDYQITLSQYV